MQNAKFRNSLRLPLKSDKLILALGAEFDTRLAFYYNGEIIFSDNIGELAEDEEKYEEFVRGFTAKALKTSPSPPSQRRGNKKPDVIITDSHPLYTSRKVGERLAKEWEIEHIEAQHHIAHVFSAVGDWLLMRDEAGALNKGLTPPCSLSRGELNFYGIACDGTGYGLDGNIWGGEVFVCHPERSVAESKDSLVYGRYSIKRIGHLEEQYLLGGELAVEEPARMLISILSKFLPHDNVFKYAEKYYEKDEFNLLWNQLGQKFNCPITTSTARVLDAVSLFLEFCENKRKYKHYAVKMLEDSSRIKGDSSSCRLQIMVEKNRDGQYILNTTELFKYLTENLGADKGQLGYIAQKYIIEGLYEIVKNYESEGKASLAPLLIKEGKLNSVSSLPKIFFSGGLASNKIMQEFAKANNIYVSKKNFSGDEGIALGQIVYLLITPSA